MDQFLRQSNYHSKQNSRLPSIEGSTERPTSYFSKNINSSLSRRIHNNQTSIYTQKMNSQFQKVENQEHKLGNDIKVFIGTEDLFRKFKATPKSRLTQRSTNPYRTTLNRSPVNISVGNDSAIIKEDQTAIYQSLMPKMPTITKLDSENSKLPPSQNRPRIIAQAKIHFQLDINSIKEQNKAMMSGRGIEIFTPHRRSPAFRKEQPSGFIERGGSLNTQLTNNGKSNSSANFMKPKPQQITLTQDLQTHLRKVFQVNKTQSATAAQQYDLRSQQFKRKMLRIYFELRYPKIITERILDYFELNNIFTISELIDKFNILLYSTRDEKMEFCFQIYDINDDELICMKDLMDLMKIIHDQDYYMQEDINKMIKYISKKQKDEEYKSNCESFRKKIGHIGIKKKNGFRKKIKISSLILKNQQIQQQNQVHTNVSSPANLAIISHRKISDIEDQNTPNSGKVTNKSQANKFDYKQQTLSPQSRVVFSKQPTKNFIQPQRINRDSRTLTRTTIIEDLTQKCQTLQAKAKENGFVKFVANLMKKEDEKNSAYKFYSPKGSKDQQYQGSSSPDSKNPKNLQMQKMLHEYMKENYFFKSEAIDIEEFCNMIKHEMQVPNIFMDILFYVFRFKYHDELCRIDEDDFEDYFDIIDKQQQKIVNSNQKMKQQQINNNNNANVNNINLIVVDHE